MKIALLFPGQGSQTVGMGKEVYEASAAARDAFEQADEALREPLSRLCFEGPADSLTLTVNTQPALVATSTALLAALRERAPQLPAPFCAAGHSLGEYSALVAAEALALGDALRLVRLRGQAMQEAVAEGQGAMAAVMGLDAPTVESLCAQASQGEVVSPANFNGTQIVIAGAVDAVARVSALATQQKAKVIPLKVSAPFHCALMAPAAQVVKKALETIRIRSLAFPVVANVDGQPNTDSERVKDLLVRQIDGVVRWEQSVRWMAQAGVTHALEVGPGKVLAGLVKRIAPEITVLSCADGGSLDAAAKVLTAQAIETSRGIKVSVRLSLGLRSSAYRAKSRALLCLTFPKR